MTANKYEELNGYLEKLGIQERAVEGMLTNTFLRLFLALMTELAKREVEREEERRDG